MEGKTLSVNLDQIYSDYEKNPRHAASYVGEEFKALLDSISEHGVKEPLIVVPSEEEGFEYELIAGFRRYTACKNIQQANRKKKKTFNYEVPVHVREIEDESKLVEEIISHQCMNTPFTPTERAKAIKMLMDQGYNEKSIAQAIGSSTSTVTSTVKLMNLPEDVMKLADDPEYKLTNLYYAGEQYGHFKKKTKDHDAIKKQIIAAVKRDGKTVPEEFKALIKKVIKAIIDKSMEESGKVDLVEKNKKKSSGTSASGKRTKRISDEDINNIFDEGADDEILAKIQSAKKSKGQEQDSLLASINEPREFVDAASLRESLTILVKSSTEINSVKFVLANVFVTSDSEGGSDDEDSSGDDDDDVDIDDLFD